MAIVIRHAPMPTWEVFNVIDEQKKLHLINLYFNTNRLIVEFELNEYDDICTDGGRHLDEEKRKTSMIIFLFSMELLKSIYIFTVATKRRSIVKKPNASIIMGK